MVRLLQNEGLAWTDARNLVEFGDLTEDEIREIFDAATKEAIKRVQEQQNSDQIILPPPLEMAEFCRQRSDQLKDDKQRDFVGDMLLFARRGINLSRARLGYLASIYIQIGGNVN
jgi:hypothetical protein